MEHPTPKPMPTTGQPDRVLPVQPTDMKAGAKLGQMSVNPGKPSGKGK